MRLRRRHTISIILVLVLAALTVWAAKNWDKWFGEPDEPAYSASPVPHRLLLTFGDSTSLSRNVSWQCGDSVVDSWVELAPLQLSQGGENSSPRGGRVEAKGEVFASRNGRAAYYVARLRQLRPNTTYTYRVVSGGKASEWHTFSTDAARPERFECLYVGDVQDTIGGAAAQLLSDAVAHHPSARFLICGGDLTERPIDKYWGETFRDLGTLAHSLPIVAATGNHDYLKRVPRLLERRFPLVFSYFLDSAVDDNMVYTFCYGSAQFFVLDTEREAPFLWAQRQWLDEQLRQSHARWKIVIAHHPFYSVKGDTNNLIPRWMFDDLLREHGVHLVLQAHEHAYARRTTHVEDSDGTTTPVYTVSHCSPKCYRIEFDEERFDRFGISSRYYQTVSISPDTLVMAAYDALSHQLYDSLLIVRPAAPQPRVIDRGTSLPENMSFTRNPSGRKDRAYADRIRQHVERRRAKGLPVITGE